MYVNWHTAYACQVVNYILYVDELLCLMFIINFQHDKLAVVQTPEVIFRLLICFKTLKKSPWDFKFYSRKLTNKSFPIWSSVECSLNFPIVYRVKTQKKVTIDQMGKKLFLNVSE